MSYANDSRTRGLYHLSIGGTNLSVDPDWNLTSNGDGTFSSPLTVDQFAPFALGSWTVEREVTMAAGVPGTILEVGAWGETEAVNIQCVIGWDAQNRIFVGWEHDGGIDEQLASTIEMAAGVPLRVAVTYRNGSLWIAVNGTRFVQAEGVPPPTGGVYGPGNTITPGMRFSVGRRVSTSDPQRYAAGGWMRVSVARSLDDIRQEWEAWYSAPRPTGLTWDELARRDDAKAYYVFRGRYRAFADSPGAVVAWATAHVHTDEGLLDGRLVEAPGPIVRGIPETPGAMPERVSSSIILDNSDGALTEAFAGGPSTATAYQGDSFLSLSGKIWRGYIGPDGVAVERAISPTLSVVGSPEITGEGNIVLQLASMDRRLLGPTEKLVTVQAVRDALHVQDGDYVPRTAAGGGGVPTAFDLNELTFLQGAISTNLDATVPYAYGRSPLKLMPVSAPGDGWLLAYVTTSRPDLSWASDWTLSKERDGQRAVNEPPARGLADWHLFSVKIQVKRQDGAMQDVWLVGLSLSGPGRVPLMETDLFLTPSIRAHVGMPAGTPATPANIIRQIVADLSERGASGINTASFARVDRAIPLVGIVGGVIDSGAALGEVITHIAGPLGIALWMESDDRLRAMLPTGWDADDRDAAAGAPTTLRLPDMVEGSWSERTPATGEVGGPATLVSVDWSSEQQGFFPAPRRLARAPGITRLALAEDQEVRISGAWVYPPDSQRALEGVGARRAFAHNRVSTAAPPWVAALDLGTLVRVWHPFGAQPGGYAGRLMRLIRTELQPSEDAATCDLLDLQALEDIRPGKLDSAQNWIQYDPSGKGYVAQFVSGNAEVIFGSPVANSTWVGCSLWTFGAGHDALRQSWRIVDVLSPTLIKIDRVATASEAILSQTAPAHRAPWIVMRNRTSHPDHRPDYITLADVATGLHTDGSPGYQFTA